MAENSSRIDAFKALSHKGSSDSLRQRRHEVTVELRKNRKDDQLAKRRNIQSVDDESPASPLQEANRELASFDFDAMQAGLVSTDPTKQFDSVQSVRRLLSRERSPPIDVVIERGVVPYLVNFLTAYEYPELQFEAAWALTNIASGNADQTKVVRNANAVPHFVELLCSPDTKVAEQAVWALGNIAGDGPEMRDYVLTLNIVDYLLRMTPQNVHNVSFMRNIVWLCSNLCRGKNPHPPIQRIKPLLPLLVNFLQHTDDLIVTDACWALSYITDDEQEVIQLVLDEGAGPELVRLLDSTAVSILTPALRSVGNIVTGSDTQTDAILEAAVLPRLQHLLTHKKPNIVKEAAWAVSNIVAGTPEQIQQVLAHGIMTEVITALTTGDFKIQKEATWVITNITTGGTTEQIVFLIERYPILKPYCDMLDSHDASVISVVLKGLENIFKVAEKLGNASGLAMVVEELGALDRLEFLQNHENNEIYKLAYELVSKYFMDEAAEEATGTTGDEKEFTYDPSKNMNGGAGFNF